MTDELSGDDTEHRLRQFMGKCQCGGYRYSRFRVDGESDYRWKCLDCGKERQMNHGKLEEL